MPLTPAKAQTQLFFPLMKPRRVEAKYAKEMTAVRKPTEVMTCKGSYGSAGFSSG